MPIVWQPFGSVQSMREQPVGEEMNSRSIEQIVAAIEKDRRLGASELASACMAGLAEFASSWQGGDTDQFRSDLLTLASQLQSARPSMEAISNLVERWCREFDGLQSRDLSKNIKVAISQAESLQQESSKAVQKTVAFMLDLIERGDVLFTHSLSSTIKLVFSGISERQVTAVITESRPGNEGKLLAQFLSELAIPTRYITDAQMGVWMPKVNKVLVGADTVLADGALVNKAGTSLLAMAAERHHIPFYVCCETLKYSKKDADALLLEEMDGEELGLQSLPHVRPGNFYFDITPARYISAWVSEQGVSSSWRRTN